MHSYAPLTPIPDHPLRVETTDLPQGWYWLQQISSRYDRVPGGRTLGHDPLCIRTPKMARLEAVLLVSETPQPARKLAQLATLVDSAEVHHLVERLNEAYDRAGCAFRIEKLASGYQLLTRPDYAPWLQRLHQRSSDIKLSPPALETLVIIAYRQPITRADLEALRGVQCADIIKQLMDRGLVRIAGEDNSLGRPFLYETTKKFLELFGLQSLDDLPRAREFRRPMHAPPAA